LIDQSLTDDAKLILGHEPSYVADHALMTLL